MPKDQSYKLLPLNSQYQTFTYVLVPISILYFGIYIMLRNHYILKPKIETFLIKSRIKSVVIRQIIIDFISNLSIITFLISSILLSYSDKCIQLMIHNDLYWAGLCMAILAYKNLKQQQDTLQMKVVTKNAIFLIFQYIIVSYQYFSSYSMFIMALSFIVIYLFNLILNAKEQQFIEFIDTLFYNTKNTIEIQPYNHINMMESPQFLSANFPVSKLQIQQKMKKFEPSLKNIKLKTKVAVTKKLLMLTLAVKISQQKMKQKMRHQVFNYYGSLNGTTNQKIKRIQFEQKYIGNQDNSNNKQNSSNQQERLININQSDDQLDVLFTIFPVKLFQSSKIVSILFSIVINLVFGVFLDYCMNITQTLQYGKYFNNLYALLILPILPNISKIQYFNSMSLSSLWKYFLLGFFIIIYIVSDGNMKKFQLSNSLQFQSILISLLIIYVIIYLLAESRGQYKIAVFFFIVFCVNLAFTHYGIINQK